MKKKRIILTFQNTINKDDMLNNCGMETEKSTLIKNNNQPSAATLGSKQDSKRRQFSH